MVFFSVLIIVILLYINRNINSKFKRFNSNLNDLIKKTDLLQQKINTQHTAPLPEEKKNPSTPQKSTFEKTINTPTPQETQKTQKKEDPSIKQQTPAIPIPTPPAPLSKSKTPPASIAPKVKQKETVKKAPQKPWIQSFKEKNPDIEKFIGENLINKVGILILVLGISFFVKYAIDKDWINEPARVGIGILAGVLVMGLAHKLKKNYSAFSSVLIAGAISIFYFTIYIAFNEYHLFSQTIAFVIMAFITAFSALVSISYNRQELAVLSLIGGFAAPFMISTGEGNYIILFTYISILNIGILSIAYFRKWKIATILAFIFTTLLFAGWCFSTSYESSFPYAGALSFAAIFYFIFSITIVLNNLRNKGVFSKIEYFILISNTFCFFGVGMFILEDWNSNYTGLFTLALAIYNSIYASVLYKKFGLDKNAIYLLLGLALTFVTLTIPIQFKGNQITIFWACEAVLLLWLSKKSKMNAFKIGAVVIQILTLVSLFMDWAYYTNDLETFAIILNPLFIAGCTVSISLWLSYKLIENTTNRYVAKYIKLNLKQYKFILIISACIITYFTGILEVNYQAYQFLENKISALAFPVTYHFIFISILLFLVLKLKQTVLSKSVLIISILSIAAYIIAFYKIPQLEISENLKLGSTSLFGFYFHYIVLACLLFFGFQLFKHSKLIFNITPQQSKWLPWLYTFIAVFIFSNEVMVHTLNFSNLNIGSSFTTINGEDTYEKARLIRQTIKQKEIQVVKIGFPILWGVFSFFILIIGIRKQWKTLRIIALSLLGVTILKLFIYDINNVSETGKIIAFILLGVLILIISFVYQKIKKLVNDETSEHDKDTKSL